jgi:hypothetical protein
MTGNVHCIAMIVPEDARLGTIRMCMVSALRSPQVFALSPLAMTGRYKRIAP